jgi:outer membrane protein TolC
MIKHLSLTTLSGLLLLGFAPIAIAQQAKPLSLSEVLRIALKESHQAKLARIGREIAQVKVERERPVASPTLDLTASGTMQGSRMTFPRPNGTEGVFLPENFARLDVTVEQLIYRAGEREAKQRYLAQREGVDWDYRRELHGVLLSVRKAMLDLLRADAGIGTATLGVGAAERYRTLVQKQIESGLAKPVDALTAETQVLEAQNGLSRAKNGRMLALANLNRYLGRLPLAEISLMEPVAPSSPPESPEPATTLALTRRPELLYLQQILKATRLGVSLAQMQSLPRVSVRGQWSLQTPTALVPQNYMAATVEVRFPLWDGDKTRLDTLEAKAQAKRLEALIGEAKQGFALEVRQAWLKLKEAFETRALAQVQLREMEAVEVVAETAYKVGKGTAVEVQEAQRKTRTARDKEIQARYDILTAVAEYENTFAEIPLIMEEPSKTQK